MTLRPRVAPLAFALAGSLLLAGCASTPPTSAVPRGDATTRQAPTPIAAFFDRFTDDWMRRQPSAATGSRYFTGALQSEMDRQLTPQTTEFRRGTLALAERGIAELARFDRDAMRDVERVSAELMDWQLRSAVEGERYEHYNFPLQQFSGANVGLPNLMTVVHPVRSEEDARNYLARLGLFETRMDISDE